MAIDFRAEGANSVYQLHFCLELGALFMAHKR